MAKLKIGICLNALNLPFKRALSEAQKMEVAGVELNAVGDFLPRNLSQSGRRELRHALRSYNLELSAIGCPLRHGLDIPDNQEARIDHVREVMSLAFELGPRLVVVQPGKFPTDEKDPRMNWLRDALTALGQHGDRIGTTVALETGLEDGDVLNQYLDRFDCGSLAVNFSPANLLMSGFNPYKAARVLGRRIVHAHAKDARTVSAGRSAQEVPLGHGDLDWMELLGALAEIEYHAWLDIDRSGSMTPVADIAAGAKFLRRLTG